MTTVTKNTIPNLTLWQKVVLSVKGYVGVEHIQRVGWKAPIQMFVFNCPNGKHGLQVDYPHGKYTSLPPWSTELYIGGNPCRLDCVLCKKEIKK